MCKPVRVAGQDWAMDSCLPVKAGARTMEGLLWVKHGPVQTRHSYGKAFPGKTHPVRIDSGLEYPGKCHLVQADPVQGSIYIQA